jgi:hypothetical protein
VYVSFDPAQKRATYLILVAPMAARALRIIEAHRYIQLSLQIRFGRSGYCITRPDRPHMAQLAFGSHLPSCKPRSLSDRETLRQAQRATAKGSFLTPLPPMGCPGLWPTELALLFFCANSLRFAADRSARLQALWGHSIVVDSYCIWQVNAAPRACLRGLKGRCYQLRNEIR